MRYTTLETFFNRDCLYILVWECAHGRLTPYLVWNEWVTELEIDG